MNIDTALRSAVQGASDARASIFTRAFERHRNHDTFRTEGWAFERAVGFTCSCSGSEREWKIDLTSIHVMVNSARETFLSIRNGQLKKQRRLANVKAKALFFRYLTREQKWYLKATKSIIVTGQDGRTYKITEGSCNNVFILDENGEHHYRLCAIAAKVWIPIYDLMLAQKVLIEHDLESYLSKARGMNVKTHASFDPMVLLNTKVNEVVKESVENDVSFRMEFPIEMTDSLPQPIQNRIFEPAN